MLSKVATEFVVSHVKLRVLQETIHFYKYGKYGNLELLIIVLSMDSELFEYINSYEICKLPDLAKKAWEDISRHRLAMQDNSKSECNKYLTELLNGCRPK